MSTRTLLVDGDIPVYQKAAAAEKPTDWGNGLWTLHAYEHEAIEKLDAFMEELEDALNADRVVIALSDKHNFRKEVLPTYKHNRSDKRPPLLRAFLNEYVKENYETFSRPSLEGDDVLGILATSKKIIKGEKIVVSIDKDLKSIPGKILNWNYANHAVKAGMARSVNDCIFEVTEEQADYYHYLQTLAGDPTDGYSGCPGLGLQSADTALSSDPHILVEKPHVITKGKNKGKQSTKWVVENGNFSVWETIVSYYARAGLGEEEALRQARVARICRNTDYDFKNKEVKLWTPK